MLRVSSKVRWHTFQLVRLLSSSSSGSSSSHQSAQFVRFRISQENAIERFTAWAESNVLAPNALKSEDAIIERRAVFLPFWIYKMNVKSTFTAEVALRSLPQYRRVVLPDKAVAYSPTQKDMQIYASFTFKRDLVQVIKLPTIPNNVAEPFHESMLRGGKEIDKWAIDHATATRKILSRVRKLEHSRGSELIAETFDAIDVRDLNVTMDYDYEYHALYLPAYIIGYTHMGRSFRCFINAFDGSLFATPVYSSTKVAGAFALPLTLLYNFLGAVGAMHYSLGSYIGSVLLPAALWGAIFQFYPLYLNQMRERKRLFEIRGEEDEEAEWDFFQKRSQESSQRREQRYQQQYQSREQQQDFKQTSYHQAKKPQNTELYRILGVSQTASLEEINSSFRKLALKHHPDVHQDAQKKKEATIRFRVSVTNVLALRYLPLHSTANLISLQNPSRSQKTGSV
jgi:hypothetical protein